jgi:hypothetical protein
MFARSVSLLLIFSVRCSLGRMLGVEPPLFYCSINKTLIGVTPFFDETLLQVVDITNPTAEHALLRLVR